MGSAKGSDDELDNSALISPEAFSRQNAVWNRVAPTLEQYMRWANNHVQGVGERVSAAGIPSRNAFISEFAFRQLFMSASEAELVAREFLLRLPRGDAAMPDLSVSERVEADRLTRNLQKYLDLTSSTAVMYAPSFPGCGAVETAQVDVMCDRELIEIKSVQRSFHAPDMRQALTYAAMAHAVNRSILHITLLNPRFGIFLRIDVDDLGPDVGAGSWIELMKDLVDAMSGAEVSL